MSLSALLAQAYPLAEARLTGAPAARCTLFFSVTDGLRRARVYRGAGPTFQQAWLAGATLCQRATQQEKLAIRWLRVDWATSVEALTWQALAARLAVTKRNYFRFGLALDADLEFAFLEQELNANAMLYRGGSHLAAGVNENNFGVYARKRFGERAPLDFSAQRSVYLFTHEGLFVAGDPAVQALPGGTAPVRLPGPASTKLGWRDPTCLNAGRRDINTLEAQQLHALIQSGSDFLAGEVKENGQFVYGHFPCFGRRIANYNTLRHASTIYAMLEAWELTRSASLFAAIQRALDYLVGTIIQRFPQPEGPTFAYNVDAGNEIKLGANAVSLLALVKYDELTSDTRYRELMEQLALGIARMQDADTGCFVHVLNAEDLSLKEAFRIVYYDGEAAFGLMRLYGLTRDSRWLAVVEKAFGYFIKAEHWKHHDHWLSYCANELTLSRPTEKYFRFAVQNIAGYLDFILQRETTYPTLLELSMAFEALLQRLNTDHPEMRHLLQDMDIDKFYRALHYRAHYLLNGFFWPEMAMYFARPASIVGSFFIRHHSFRVRIDDVEHYLSGYVAYWKMLTRRPPAAGPDTFMRNDAWPPAELPFLANWNAGMLAEALRGRWQREAGQNWRATGVALTVQALQPGNVVIARVENRTRPVGISLAAFPRLPFHPQAVVVEQTGADVVFSAYQGPVLVVPDMAVALLRLGAYSRTRFRGQVIGVTGSAGKTTTCAMLAHMLRAWGAVGASRLSANTTRGIAWNMASIPWNSRYAVLEMAIAGMDRSSQMVLPHVAVLTNVGPAHLQYHFSTENIAQKKSAIFNGMAAGGSAVINADMLHADVFKRAAMARGIRVTTYGEAESADCRLLEIDADAGTVTVQLAQQRYCFEVGRFSRHMVENALACIAVAHVLGLDIRRAMHQFADFQPLPGRGAQFTLIQGGKPIRVIDESYNANPLSMRAALKYFGRITAAQQGVLLLGDMLELDAESARLHTELLPAIVEASPRLVMMVGDHMKPVCAALADQGLHACWYADVRHAWEAVVEAIGHEEILMVKGSNSTGLHALLRNLACQAQRQ